MNPDCIFCKIINGQIPSAKFWENENFVAILDINPNTKGASLVLPKKHYSGYIFESPDEVVSEILVTAKTPVKMLEKAFKVSKVALAFEGTGVDHLHLHLYPLHGLDTLEIGEHNDPVFFDSYPGYISTKLGPHVDMEELERLREFILSQG